jgi:hypothetical protein
MTLKQNNTMTLELYNQLRELGKRPFNLDETLLVLRSNRPIFWSWGVSKLLKVESQKQEEIGLVMKVNGHHHKSWVLITLSWDDTYTIHIINNVGRVLNIYENIYFDQLVEVIDNRIEKIPNYQF